MKPFIPYKEELYHILTLEKGQTFVIARPVEPQPQWRDEAWYWSHPNYDNGAGVDYFHTVHLEGIMEAWGDASPFGKEGEEFFAQEVWAVHSGYNQMRVDLISIAMNGDYEGCIEYQATPNTPSLDCWGKWREASTMPQWASRRTIRNAGTECKRVWDLTRNEVSLMGINDFSFREASENRWQSRYGDQYPWQGNPWAFLTTMEVR